MAVGAEGIGVLAVWPRYAKWRSAALRPAVIDRRARPAVQRLGVPRIPPTMARSIPLVRRTRARLRPGTARHWKSTTDTRSATKTNTGGARRVVYRIRKVTGRTGNPRVIIVGAVQVRGGGAANAQPLSIPRKQQRTEDRGDPTQSRNWQLPADPSPKTKGLGR